MEAETYLTPDKALEYGLIDEIYNKRTASEGPEELLQKLSQLQKQLTSQQSFREQIALLKNGRTPEKTKEESHSLMELFKGMTARKGE